jgi:putative endonuclease
MFYVYILYSTRFDKFYIGQTNDLDNRLERHNAGTVSSTKPFLPWKMIFYISKETRSEALILEKKLKNLTKARILDFIKKYKSV